MARRTEFDTSSFSYGSPLGTPIPPVAPAVVTPPPAPVTTIKGTKPKAPALIPLTAAQKAAKIATQNAAASQKLAVKAAQDKAAADAKTAANKAALKAAPKTYVYNKRLSLYANNIRKIAFDKKQAVLDA